MKIKTLEILSVKDKLRDIKNDFKKHKLKVDEIFTNFNKNSESGNVPVLERTLNNLRDDTKILREDIGKSVVSTIITLNTHAEKEFTEIKKYHFDQITKVIRKYEADINRSLAKIIKFQLDNLKSYQKLKYIDSNKNDISILKENLDTINEKIDKVTNEIE